MGNQRVLADTSVLIEYFRKYNKADSMLYKLSKEFDICISSITAFEFLSGTNQSNKEAIKELLKRLDIINFDLDCADIAGNIYRQLKTENKIIDTADILIGATALKLSVPLATLNLKHFERIKGLEFY